MSGLKEIKTRLGAVQNATKITKSMKMVSAARLRSAQRRALNLRGYAGALEELLKDAILSQKFQHPFLEQKKDEDIKRALIVILTSDRGLCGAFNGNLCRFAEEFFRQKKYETQDLFFIGKKGFEYFKFRGAEPKGLILNLVREISYPLAARIAKELMDKILSGDYGGVFMIYNEFKTVISPRLACERFLPFDLSSKRPAKRAAEMFSRDIIFEVSPKELMDSLLERYFSIQVYRCLCEHVSAEHGARMSAMENATKSAEELAEKLTLRYNKLRQSSITTELTEIVAGAESLK